MPRSTPPVPPPPQYSGAGAQPTFSPTDTSASGGNRSVLVVIGVIAGAAIGAGIALGLMTIFDVSPF